MHHRIFGGHFFLATAVFLVLAISTGGAANSPVKIIKRTVMFGGTEDTAFISKGALANHLVLLDSYDVLAIPDGGLAVNGMKKIFDLRALDITENPRGLAYVESQDTFWVNSLNHYDQLLGIDIKGNPKGVVTINYRNGYFPRFVEGLEFIPPTATLYPNHFAMVTRDPAPDYWDRIEIIGLNGDVDAEIILPTELYGAHFLGVAFLPPDRLVVSTTLDIDANGSYNNFYIFDLLGNLLAGPIQGPVDTTLEGLAVTKTGAIACAGSGGVLRYVDQSLNPLSNLDRTFRPELGLNNLSGIAWNSATDHFFLVRNKETFQPARLEGDALPPSLDSYITVVDLTAAGLNGVRKFTYLPGERLLAASFRNTYPYPTNPINPRSIILLSETGATMGEVDLEPLNLGRPDALAFIPSLSQFAVCFLENPAKLRILSRTGALLRSIDLSSAGVAGIGAVEYFNPAHESGGQFLVVTKFPPFPEKKLLVTDFYGNILQKISYPDDLGISDLCWITDLALITSGPDAGAFAATVARGNNAGYEIIVFKLRDKGGI